MRANSVPSRRGVSVLVLALLSAGCANTQAGGGEVAGTETPRTAQLGSPTGGAQTGENTANMARMLGAPAYSTPTPAPGAISNNPPPSAQGVAEPELLPPPPPQAQAEPAEVPAAPPAAAPASASASSRQDAAAPAVDLAAGRQLFNDWSCGACHVLGDAGGTGHVGPSLDGNGRLTLAATTRIISAGQGAMPGFAGQLTDEEIATLSAYIMQAKR